MMSHLAAAAVEPGYESAQQAVAFPSLFVLVILGSLMPVVPTGALVSSAAVVGFHDRAPLTLLLVFAVASLAAFVGDTTLYWLGRRGAHSQGGSRWLKRLQDRVEPHRLQQAQHRLERHGVLVLVLSRLVPAGRIPVMVACLLAGMPTRRFLRGDAAACLAWAGLYQAIGILGGSLLPEPWQGVALAVGLALLIGAAPGWYRRLRRLRGRSTETDRA